MEFIVKIAQNKGDEPEEQGPIDQETLIKWIEIGKVRPGTPIRNALMRNWNEAGDMDFLKEKFEKQLEELGEEDEGFWESTGSLLGVGKKKEKKDKRTAFIHKYLPNPAPLSLRISAAVYDWIILSAVALVIFFAGVAYVYTSAIASTEPDPNPAFTEKAAEEKSTDASEKMEDEGDKKAEEEKEAVAELPPPLNNPEAERLPHKGDDETKGYRLGSKWTDKGSGIVYSCLNGTTGDAVWVEVGIMNSLFYKLFIIFAIIVLMYYGISLGFFAQTYGMYYWGIFIAKPDVGEVFPFRAFCYAVLMILIGITTPISIYIIPNKRSLQGLLCGTTIIRISAKPKA